MPLKNIGYIINRDEKNQRVEDYNHNQITYTFEEAIQLPENLELSGTLKDNATVALSSDGKELKVTSEPGAKEGDSVIFNTVVGATEVEVTLTWNKRKWVLTSEPDVFKDQTKYDNASINIELAKDGLLTPDLDLEQLTKDDELLNLKVLPGSGLEVGDVINLGDTLQITLNENDFNDDGTVNLKVNSNLLPSLLGKDEGVTITAEGERDGKKVTDSKVLDIPVPILNPVTNLVDSLVDDLKYEILGGKKPIKVEIGGLHVAEDGSLHTIRAGDEIKLHFTGNSKEKDFTFVVTEEDINKGFVEYTLKNEDNLLSSLLGSTLIGKKVITVQPEYIFKENGQEVATVKGEKAEIQLSKGLLNELDGFLGLGILK